MFNCLDKREDVQNRAYGTDHLAMCVEDKEGVPIFVVDLDTGKDQSKILKPVQVSGADFLSVQEYQRSSYNSQEFD